MLGIIITLSIILLLTFCTAVVPVLRVQKERNRRQIHEAYRAVKLRAVRRHYPALQSLSDREILAHFDITSAYNNIGR